MQDKKTRALIGNLLYNIFESFENYIANIKNILPNQYICNVIIENNSEQKDTKSKNIPKKEKYHCGFFIKIELNFLFSHDNIYFQLERKAEKSVPGGMNYMIQSIFLTFLQRRSLLRIFPGMTNFIILYAEIRQKWEKAQNTMEFLKRSSVNAIYYFVACVFLLLPPL